MDIPTKNIKIPETAKMLDKALLCLAQSSHENIINNSNCWAKKETKTRKDNRFYSEEHYHPYPEIAMVIDGKCFFEIEGKTFTANCGDIIICQAQLKHCEGILKKTIGYSLLWLSGSQRSLIASISQYSPQKGWSFPYRGAMSDNTITKLFTPFINYEIPPIKKWYLQLRSNLFVILSRLYKESLQIIDSSDQTKKSALEKHRPILYEIETFLQNHFTEHITLSQLAQSTGISPNYLNTLFRQHKGLAIHSYITKLRMTQAATLLKTTDMLAKQIAQKVGYDDPLYFSRIFKKYYNKYPSEF